MIIDTYDPRALQHAFGIGMSGVEGLGVGAGWGRVVPGRASTSHQHDETELFVIVAGEGEFVVDGRRHPARPGTLALFEPFESHVLENTGDADLVFLTQYWRDPVRAMESSGDGERLSFGDRPVFVFSTPPTPNGDLHLGHLSGPYLGADAFVRFQRMNGADAWHLTGSDDYQSWVVGAARREGRTPAETAAHYSAEIARTLALYADALAVRPVPRLRSRRPPAAWPGGTPRRPYRRPRGQQPGVGAVGSGGPASEGRDSGS